MLRQRHLGAQPAKAPSVVESGDAYRQPRLGAKRLLVLHTLGLDRVPDARGGDVHRVESRRLDARVALLLRLAQRVGRGRANADALTRARVRLIDLDFSNGRWRGT